MVLDVSWPEPRRGPLEFSTRNRRRGRKSRNVQSSGKLKYVAGMAAGILAIHWTKQLVRKLPVLGWVISPVLDLIPTAVAGPALGAAVVYGMEKEDMAAPVKLVQGHLDRLSTEASRAADELAAEARELARRNPPKKVLRELEEKTTPVLETLTRDANRIGRNTLEGLQRDAQELHTVVARSIDNLQKQQQGNGGSSGGAVAQLPPPGRGLGSATAGQGPQHQLPPWISSSPYPPSNGGPRQ